MSNRGSRHGIYLRGSHWYARAALRSPKYIMNLCMSVHRAIISARWKTSLSNPFCLSEKMYERPPPSWSPIPVLIALTLPTAKPHPLEPLSNSTPPTTILLSLPDPLAFSLVFWAPLGRRQVVCRRLFHSIKWRERWGDLQKPVLTQELPTQPGHFNI